VASFLLALAVSATVCALALWVGPRIGSVDHPDDPDLKAHTRPAVPLGGIGIYLALTVASLVADRLDPWVVVAGAIVLVLGVIDDRVGLPPVARLLVEAIAGVVVAVGIVGFEGGWVSPLLGFGLTVLAINAVNLLDGLDGLAGTVGLVTALGLVSATAARGLDTGSAWALVAALAGFLLFNWHPARIFMGDGGAYVLGLTLTILILQASDGDGLEVVFLSSMLGLFVIDLIVTLVRRTRNGASLFLGDRSHLYDQLRDRGRTVPVVALSAGLFQVIWIGVALAVDRRLHPIPGIASMVIVAAAVLGVFAAGGYLRSEPAA
jgi:UDP-GlcNAc:undecaprenyl-phosphate/decaprenyl-phosphate GlcNAc-1-phosphate transferase